jgi:hypothetical protein
MIIIIDVFCKSPATVVSLSCINSLSCTLGLPRVERCAIVYISITVSCTFPLISTSLTYCNKPDYSPLKVPLSRSRDTLELQCIPTTTAISFHFRNYSENRRRREEGETGGDLHQAQLSAYTNPWLPAPLSETVNTSVRSPSASCPRASFRSVP